jgi:signal recognition particle subunit SRP54
MFASTGEKLDDFDVFHPERMASRILGMGDVLTLIETAEKHYDSDQAERAAAKLSSGEGFDLEDFLEQMHQIKKMGSLTSLLGMLPGMGQMKDALAQVKDSDLDRITAIIQSMTPQERRDAKILNASRRIRIAKGSGTSVPEVNNLVDRFSEAAKMMKGLAASGGLPGMPGMNRKAKRQQPGKKKGKGPGRAGGGPSRAQAALPPSPLGLPPAPNPLGLPQSPPGPDPLGLYRKR